MTTHQDKKQEFTPKASHVDTLRPQGAVSNPLSLLNRPGTAARQNPFQLKHASQNPLKPMNSTQNLYQLLAKGAAQQSEPLQLQAQPREEQEPVQKKPNNTGLPDNLKKGVENLSGYSMDDVKVGTRPIHRTISSISITESDSQMKGRLPTIKKIMEFIKRRSPIPQDRIQSLITSDTYHSLVPDRNSKERQKVQANIVEHTTMLLNETLEEKNYQVETEKEILEIKNLLNIKLQSYLGSGV